MIFEITGYCPVQEREYKIKVKYIEFRELGVPNAQYKGIFNSCDYALETNGANKNQCEYLHGKPMRKCPIMNVAPKNPPNRI
jgi:hypothetical protein